MSLSYPAKKSFNLNFFFKIGFMPPPPPRSHGSGSSGSRSERNRRPPPLLVADRFGSQSTIDSSIMSDRTIDSEMDDASSIA